MVRNNSYNLQLKNEKYFELQILIICELHELFIIANNG